MRQMKRTTSRTVLWPALALAISAFVDTRASGAAAGPGMTDRRAARADRN